MGTIKKISQAVILAGGQGVRLRPLTNDLPKPMVVVAGRPFADYLVELLKRNGITEIVFLLGYMPEKFVEYFGDGKKFGLSITYSIGKVEDETGTRVRNAAPILHDNFLLMYGDNYWPLPLDALVDFYRRMNVLTTMTVYNNRDGRGEYGWKNNLQIAEDDRVRSYGTLSDDQKFQGLDIGFFICSKKILEHMPAENFSLQSALLPKLIAMNELAAYRTDEYYYTITTPEFVERATAFFKSPRAV